MAVLMTRIFEPSQGLKEAQAGVVAQIHPPDDIARCKRERLG